MTAVEWYIKKIKEARQMCDDASMGMDIWHTLDVLIGKGEQAKEMEKEQRGYSESDMRFYASYILNNPVIEPSQWYKIYRTKSE